MTWVAWRQLRPQLLLTLALLGAFAVLIIVTGLNLRHVFHAVGGAGCIQVYICSRVKQHDSTLAAVLGPVLLATPALLGMFWGAPLVARELETGTYRLAWTQSITRRKWLSVKVAVVGVAVVVVAGMMSWLVSWWYGPLDAVKLDRLDPSVFTERGIVAIGYAAFAYAVGVAAGALIRRVLPAMMATLLGFAAVRLLVTVLRSHLLPAAHAVITWRSPSRTRAIANGWTLSSTRYHAGHVLTKSGFVKVVLRTCRLTDTASCRPIRTKRFREAVLHRITYQPASHYWPLQAIETGIFVVAALALLAITIRCFAPRSAAASTPPEQTVEPPVPKLVPDIG